MSEIKELQEVYRTGGGHNDHIADEMEAVPRNLDLPPSGGKIGDINHLLSERGARYGEFKDHAHISQRLKTIVGKDDGWLRLSHSQKEAVEMIMHKVARILNGDPNYDDSWRDIAGYATLIVKELNGERI